MLLAAKAKQVIALEINPENISRINDNLSLNEGFDKIITVHNIGASNKKTVAALDKRVSRVKDRVLDMSEDKTDAEDVIRVDVLDNNIAANLDIKHIDLVMMDIEAREIYALEGMKELLSKKAVKHLNIEVQPKILQQIGKTEAEVIRIPENSGHKVDKLHKESEAAYHVHAYS